MSPFASRYSTRTVRNAFLLAAALLAGSALLAAAASPRAAAVQTFGRRGTAPPSVLPDISPTWGEI
ncbi:hypothetical protein, partial [Mesorhizobium sp.]|uniref:hypothetical protein n=1 Tax=Mesorhizobium sp. TaxID=1871066 RepID=UPI0025DF469F